MRWFPQGTGLTFPPEAEKGVLLAEIARAL